MTLSPLQHRPASPREELRVALASSAPCARARSIDIEKRVVISPLPRSSLARHAPNLTAPTNHDAAPPAARPSPPRRQTPALAKRLTFPSTVFPARSNPFRRSEAHALAPGLACSLLPDSRKALRRFPFRTEAAIEECAPSYDARRRCPRDATPWRQRDHRR